MSSKGSQPGRLQAALGLLLLVAIVIAGYFLLRIAWSLFADLDPQVSAAIAVALSAVVVVPLTRWFDRKKYREEPLQSRKVEVYSRFVRGLVGAMLSGKDSLESDLKEFFADITPDLTIWASDEVLRRWSVMRRRFADEHYQNIDAAVLMIEIEDLMKAVRRDLGHGNKNLQSGDILGLWVNDVGDWSADR